MQINNSLNQYSTSNNSDTGKKAAQKGEVRAPTSLISSSVVSDIQDVCQEALFQLADYVFYSSWHNPTLGKLVSGTICTASGTYCIVKSQIPQRAFQWFNKKSDDQSVIEENDSEKEMKASEEIESLTIDKGNDKVCLTSEEQLKNHSKMSHSHKRVALFALGTLTAMYGVYNIVTGLYELFSLDDENVENRNLPAIHAPTTPSYPTKCQQGESVVGAKQVIYDLNKCPQSFNLLKEIHTRDGNVRTMDLIGNDETYRDFYGRWEGGTKRTVYVKGELCYRNKLSTVLYEFLNANTSKIYEQIQEEALAGRVSRENYTRKLEEIGYKNRLSHHQIVQACIQTNDWDPRIDIYALVVERYKNFESFWKAAKDSPHSNLYRHEWNNLYKKNFCKKHRNASECKEKASPQYELSSHLRFKDEL